MAMVSPKARVAGLEPGFTRQRMLARSLGMPFVFATLVWLLGGSAATATLVASAALIACYVERRECRAEATSLLQVSTAAAQVEGQRDAIAQVMSLELAHERSRSVLEALREGVVVVDEGGEVVMANPAARRALAQPHGEPIGRALWEVLVPELAGRAREAFDALGCDAGESALPEIRYSAIPCGDRIYDLTAVQVTSRRTGQDFGTLFLLVDATRTHELQRIKDRFLSSVSHELRTPLTNICASSELLTQMPAAAPGAAGEPAEWTEFASVIHQESVELSELVDALFDYLQLESGDAPFAEEPVDGVGVVRQVVEASAERAAARGIHLELHVDDAAPALEGDERRLAQVVRHLVDNAVKFGREGGRVSVAVTGVDAGFELRIEDDGPGVPPDDRQAVFEKFSQLRDHLTDKPSGTGIGLASSRAIVARFGGLIWCEDASLGGACFVVLLPAAGQPRLAGFGAGTGAGGGF